MAAVTVCGLAFDSGDMCFVKESTSRLLCTMMLVTSVLGCGYVCWLKAVERVDRCLSVHGCFLCVATFEASLMAIQIFKGQEDVQWLFLWEFVRCLVWILHALFTSSICSSPTAAVHPTITAPHAHHLLPVVVRVATMRPCTPTELVV